MGGAGRNPDESGSSETALYWWEISTSAAGNFVITLVLERPGAATTREAQATVKTEDEARAFILGRDPQAVIASKPTAGSS